MREASGIEHTPLARSHISYKDRLVAARTQLGEATFERAWAEGKAMTHEEAVEYALVGELAPFPDPEAAPLGNQPGVLTRREEEIASLVARGLTNRRISEELSISERTVSTHVGRILKKLGLGSREQVAARMASQSGEKPGGVVKGRR